MGGQCYRIGFDQRPRIAMARGHGLVNLVGSRDFRGIRRDMSEELKFGLRTMMSATDELLERGEPSLALDESLKLYGAMTSRRGNAHLGHGIKVQARELFKRVLEVVHRDQQLERMEAQRVKELRRAMDKLRI